MMIPKIFLPVLQKCKHKHVHRYKLIWPLGHEQFISMTFVQYYCKIWYNLCYLNNHCNWSYYYGSLAPRRLRPLSIDHGVKMVEGQIIYWFFQNCNTLTLLSKCKMKASVMCLLCVNIWVIDLFSALLKLWLIVNGF